MSAPELGRWAPLTIGAVIDTFAPATFRWWISGGHALELHLQRRAATIRVPWHLVVLGTADGIAYLSPELQLLYKSKHLRPKDDVDVAEVTPTLDARARDVLAWLLDLDHPWRRLLD